MGTPGIVGITVCFPVCVASKQIVFARKAVIHASVELLVDSSRGHLSYKVVLQAGPVGGRIRRGKERLGRGVEPVRANYVRNSVALKLSSRRFWIVDRRQTGSRKI